MKCIYCKKEEGITFNKTEHVLPQSFGKFEKNIVLRGIVCDECNQKFGNELEPALARDTFEGNLRYDSGMKEKEQFKNLGKKSKMEIKIMEGEFIGAYAFREFDEKQQEIVLRLLPQIGFRKDDKSSYEYYKIGELPDVKEILQHGYNLDLYGSIMLLRIDVESANIELENKGFKPIKVQGEVHDKITSDNKKDCEVSRIVDSTICRCYVKIAFNYLAANFYSELLYGEMFDEIRCFVLNGIEASERIIQPINEDLLEVDRGKSKKLFGHIITCEGNWITQKVYVNISIFNSVNYRIEFPEGSYALVKGNDIGHLFNLGDHAIVELGHY